MIRDYFTITITGADLPSLLQAVGTRAMDRMRGYGLPGVLRSRDTDADLYILRCA